MEANDGCSKGDLFKDDGEPVKSKRLLEECDWGLVGRGWTGMGRDFDGIGYDRSDGVGGANGQKCSHSQLLVACRSSRVRRVGLQKLWAAGQGALLT